jgi:hypothetical protein
LQGLGKTIEIAALVASRPRPLVDIQLNHKTWPDCLKPLRNPGNVAMKRRARVKAAIGFDDAIPWCVS